MSNQEKKNGQDFHDSTTEFFLKMIKKEQKAPKKEKDVNKDSFDFNTSKTFNKVSKLYNYINKTIDKLLSNNRNIFIISIILTLVLFFTISGGDFLSSPTSGTTLENVPIEIIGLDDDYEISGVPENITVGLIGPSLDIYSTKIIKDYQVSIDVTGFKTGDYTVNLVSKNFSDSLKVMLVPSSLKVNIAKKIDSTFQLGYQYVNVDEMDSEYSVALDKISNKKVTVRASKQTISKIAKVQACIDVSEKTKNFETDAPIKAFDQQGNELNVEITPKTAHVSCIVSSYSKEVSIKPRFVGSPKEGFALKNYILSSSTVKVFGSKKNLKDVSEITCDIDISDLQSSTSMNNIPLIKSDKIDKLSSDTIDVTLELEKAITKKFNKIPIKVLNKSSNTKVSFVGSGGYASVSVTGASSIVSKLSMKNIEATIDVHKLEVGSRKVLVKVVVDDDTLSVRLLSSNEISINIERK